MGGSIGTLPGVAEERRSTEEKNRTRSRRLDEVLTNAESGEGPCTSELLSRRVEVPACLAALQLARASGEESIVFGPKEPVLAGFCLAATAVGAGLAGSFTGGEGVAYLSVSTAAPTGAAQQQVLDSSRDFEESSGTWSFTAPGEPGVYAVRLFVAPRGRKCQEVLEVARRRLLVGARPEALPLELGEALQYSQGGVEGTEGAWLDVEPEEGALMEEALRRGETEVCYAVGGEPCSVDLRCMSRLFRGETQRLRRVPSSCTEAAAWLHSGVAREPLGPAAGLGTRCHWQLTEDLRRRRAAVLRLHRALEEEDCSEDLEASATGADERREVSAAAAFTRGLLCVLLEPALSGSNAALATQILSTELAQLRPFTVATLPADNGANTAVFEAAAAMAAVCHRLLASPGATADMAALLFRLALLRGSVEDALTVALWLLERREDEAAVADRPTESLEGLWPMLRDLHAMHGPSAVEEMVEDGWRLVPESGSSSGLRRAVAVLSAEGLQEAGDAGVCIDVKLDGIADEVLVGLSGLGSRLSLGAGAASIAVSHGVCRRDGKEETWGRSFRAGDLIRFTLRKYKVHVAVNGDEWGEVPLAALWEEGAQAEVKLTEGAEAVFELFPACEAAVPWGYAARQKPLDVLEREARAETDSEPMALASALLWCLGRNAQLVPAAAELAPVVVESRHRYHPNESVSRCVRIPGATRLRVEFDARCETEDQNDWLQFTLDEAQVQLVGPQHGRFTGKGPWAPFEVEGDTLWYWFRSDGADERWGYRFIVTPILGVMASSPRPLTVEPTPRVLALLERLLRRARHAPALGPLALQGLFALLPPHLHRTSSSATSLAPFAGVADAFMQLAEQPPTPAAERLAVEMLEKAGDVLFRSAAARARAMVELHREGRSRSVAEALGAKLEGAAASFAPLLNRPQEAEHLLLELLELAVAHAQHAVHRGTAPEGEPRAARQLLRVWRDVLSRFARESGAGSDASAPWSVVVGVLSRALSAAVQLLASAPHLAKAILDVVCAPLLHTAALLHWRGAPQAQVCVLLPRLVALSRAISAATLLEQATGAGAAALALLSALARARCSSVALGPQLSVTGGMAHEAQKDAAVGAPEPPAEAAAHPSVKAEEFSASMPFVHGVPAELLEEHIELVPLPPEVETVLEATSLRGEEEEEDGRLDEEDVGAAAGSVLLEMAEGTSENAKALEVRLCGDGRAPQALAVTRLAFALLVRRRQCEAVLEEALRSSREPHAALQCLWLQALQVGTHSRSLGQRLATEDLAGDPSADFVERLRFALRCDGARSSALPGSTGSTLHSTPAEVPAPTPCLSTRTPEHVARATSEEASVLRLQERSAHETAERCAQQMQQLLHEPPLLLRSENTGSAQEAARHSFSSRDPSDVEHLQVLLTRPLVGLCATVAAASSRAWHVAAWLALLAEVTESSCQSESWALAEVLEALVSAWRWAVLAAARPLEARALAAVRRAQRRAASTLTRYAVAHSGLLANEGAEQLLRALVLAGLCSPWGNVELRLMQRCLQETQCWLPWARGNQSVSPSPELRLASWLLHLTALGVARRGRPPGRAEPAALSLLHALLEDAPAGEEPTEVAPAESEGAAPQGEEGMDPDPASLWEHDANPSHQHFDISTDGTSVTYRRGAPDYCNVLARGPVQCGVHFFEFVMHKIGDEQWTGLTEDPQVAGTRTSLRSHRASFTYYCGRRKKSGNLTDGVASLHCAGQAEQRMEHVVDGDVLGLLVDCDRHRCIFLHNGVVQAMCAVPAKPLWPITHLDSTGDRTELCKKPVTRELLQLAGRSAPPWLAGLDLPLLRAFGLADSKPCGGNHSKDATAEVAAFQATDAGGFAFCAAVPALAWLRTLGLALQAADPGPLVSELRARLLLLSQSGCALQCLLAVRVLGVLPCSEETSRAVLQLAGKGQVHPAVEGEALDVFRSWLSGAAAAAASAALCAALKSAETTERRVALRVLGEPPSLRCLGHVVLGENHRGILLNSGAGLQPAVVLDFTDGRIRQVPLTTLQFRGRSAAVAHLSAEAIAATVEAVLEEPLQGLHALRVVLTRPEAAVLAVRKGVLARLLPCALAEARPPEFPQWAGMHETCREDFCALLQVAVAKDEPSASEESPEIAVSQKEAAPSVELAAAAEKPKPRASLEELLRQADELLEKPTKRSAAPPRLCKAARIGSPDASPRPPALLEELPEEVAELPALEVVLRLMPSQAVPGLCVAKRGDLRATASRAAAWAQQQLALAVSAQVLEGWLRAEAEMKTLGGAGEVARLCGMLVKNRRPEAQSGLRSVVLEVLAGDEAGCATFARWALAHLLGILAAGQRQLVEESPSKGCTEPSLRRLGIAGARSLLVELDHRSQLRGGALRVLRDSAGHPEEELAQFAGCVPWTPVTVPGEVFWLKAEPGSAEGGCSFRLQLSGDAEPTAGVSLEAGLWLLRVVLGVPGDAGAAAGGRLSELAAVLVDLAESRVAEERLQALAALNDLVRAPGTESLDWGYMRDAVEALLVRVLEVGQSSVAQPAAQLLVACGAQPRGGSTSRRFLAGGARNCSITPDGAGLMCTGGPALCLLDGGPLELDAGHVESLTVAGGHESVVVGVAPAGTASLPAELLSPGIHALQLSGRLLADGACSEVSPAHGRRSADVAEDATLSCEVSSSSNSDRCRRALYGVEHFWESRGDTPSPHNPHWLQLALPAGLELRRLVLHCRKFDSYSPKTVRVRVGSAAEVQAMVAVGDTELDDREYRATLVDEARLNDLEDSPRFVRFEVIENRGINCKIAGLQVLAGQSGFRGTCAVTATCDLGGPCPRLVFDTGKGARCSVSLPPDVPRWRFIVGAEARGAKARLMRRPLVPPAQRLEQAAEVLRAFAEAGSSVGPEDLPDAFVHDLFADWWAQPGGGADDEREASRPRPWLKAEAGELCSFGAGVGGCNGMFRPVEYDDGGHVVLYMNDQGAIMFRVEEGWRMNSEFNVSEFDYSAGVDAMGVWTPQVPAKGSPPTVCGPQGPPARESTTAPKEEPPEDAWSALSSRLEMSVPLQSGAKRLGVEGAESIEVRIDTALPCGFAVAIFADEAGTCPLGSLASPEELLELPFADCVVQGIVQRTPVWSLEECSGRPNLAVWELESNPGKQHLQLENGGRVVSYKAGAPDFCSIVSKAPVESGVHLFEFVMHKIGDELWAGVADDPQIVGHKTNLRVHRNAYTYYCGRRRGGSNNLRDGQSSLQNGGKAEQKFEHVVDGDVVGLLLNADRHRAVFFKNQVKQGECVLPAKPLWLILQLDAAEDRVELRRAPVTPDLEELIGAASSSDNFARADGSLHGTLLLGPPRDTETITERFSVTGLFQPVQASLPAAFFAYAGPVVKVSALAAGEAGGHLELGAELAFAGASGAATEAESGPAITGPWLLGGGAPVGGAGGEGAATPSSCGAVSLRGDSERCAGTPAHVLQDGPLEVGDTVCVVAVFTGEERRRYLVALAFLRNRALAAFWDLSTQGSGPGAGSAAEPSALRVCVRSRNFTAELQLLPVREIEGPAVDEQVLPSGVLSAEAWLEVLRLVASPPEPVALSVTVRPGVLLPWGKQRLVEGQLPDSWAEFKQLGFEGWSSADDEALIELLQRAIENSGTQPLNLAQLRGLLGKGCSGLRGHDARSLHVRYNLLRGLNTLVSADVLPFVDVKHLRVAPHGRLLLACRHFLLPELRDRSFRDAIERTATNGEEALHLDRTLALQCRDAGRCDATGEAMVFGQAARQAARWPSRSLRSQAPPFRVRYRDEPGQDSGGVYRDFLDTVADELMSSQLPILLPTPNHDADAGEHRDSFLLNPALDVSPASAGRRMLHFLGQLMGVCLRRGDILPLCLSQVVWKGLLGEELGLEDLASFDIAAAESVRQLSRLEPLGVDEDMFNNFFEGLRFVATDSAGQERELQDQGRATAVTFDQAPRFARLLQELRLGEAQRQLQHLRLGLATVVAPECLMLWTWRHLEERVCGVALIDVGLLRRYARYDGLTQEAREVGFLWATLELMSQSDLRRFLHFVWGRSRLPPEGSPKWAEGFKVVRQTSGGNPDTWLPTAHTCFFQLDLPAYSSQEVCQERILFAIHNCLCLGIA